MRRQWEIKEANFNPLKGSKYISKTDKSWNNNVSILFRNTELMLNETPEEMNGDILLKAQLEGRREKELLLYYN